MEFETDGDSFARAAANARNATSVQEPRVLLTVVEGEARLVGASGTFQIGSGFPARRAQPGSCTVQADDLQQIAKALSKSPSVFVKIDNDQVVITSGRARFSIPVILGTQFPAIDVSNFDELAQSSAPGQLAEAIGALLSAVASDSAPMESLKGIHFKRVEEGMRLTASDGTRLHVSVLDIEADLPEAGVVVPQKAVREMARLGQKRALSIMATEGQVYATAGSEHMLASLIDSPYPAVDNLLIIPEYQFDIPRQALVDAVVRMRAVLDQKERQPIIRMHFADQVLALHTEGENKRADESLPIDGDASFDTGLNAAFLLDALQCFASESVVLHYTTSDAKIVLRDPDMPPGNGPMAIIMPVRL